MPGENISQFSCDPRQFHRQLVNAFHSSADFIDALSELPGKVEVSLAKIEASSERVQLAELTNQINQAVASANKNRSAVYSNHHVLYESELFTHIEQSVPALSRQFEEFLSLAQSASLLKIDEGLILTVEKSANKKNDALRTFEVIHSEWKLAKAIRKVLYREVLGKHI